MSGTRKQNRPSTARDDRSEQRGLQIVMAAFDALRAATRTEDELRPGRDHLPASETSAARRALRIVQILDDARVARPDRLASIEHEGTRAFHVAPLYAMRTGKGGSLEIVADPFLCRAPCSLSDWMQQTGTGHVSYLFPDALLAQHRRELMHADTLRDPGKKDVTTQRGGEGTEDDAHGVAKLLRVWLQHPDDPSQVERFRKLFGETTWAALARDYPRLLADVERALKRA